MVMALLHWCLEGCKSHKGLANVCYLQFGVLWAQKSSVGQQTGPQAFNCLRIPFCTLIRIIKATLHPYYYYIQYHYCLEKSSSKQFEFGYLKVIHPQNYSKGKDKYTCCNFHYFNIIHQEALLKLLLEITISPNAHCMCVEAGFCQIQWHLNALILSIQLNNFLLIFHSFRYI